MKEKFAISRFGLGTAQFGMDYGFSKALDQKNVNAILDAALSAGINFLDTARDYGDSEDKIGKYRLESKKTFVVATKLTKIDEESSKDKARIKQIVSDSIDRSKNALNKSLIQLLFVHQTDEHIVNNPLFWSAIRELKECMPDFAIKFGVSVYDPEPTREIIENWGDVIDCIQAPYNVVDRRFEFLADLFQKNTIVFISRSTFLKGTLVEERLPYELKGLEPLRKKLLEISKKTEFSVPQLLMLFALSAPFIDCTLIGVRTVEQLRENLDLNKSLEEFRKYRKELEIEADPFLRDPRQWKTL